MDAATARPHTADLTDAEYMAYLRRRIAQQRVPYTGSIELTHRCNLRCVHCYLGDQAVIPRAQRKELDTFEWMGLLDQAAGAGCLELLITGGEPMIRKDFLRIYAYARELGLIVSVFCNGTLVTPRIAEVFQDLPPFLVEITLYGATAKTQDRITQRAGSFDRCMKGIELLMDHHVSVGLKTIVMKPNRHEYRDMESMARARGLKWRLDSAICPCLPNADSGGVPNRCTTVEVSRLYGAGAAASPVDLRVDPEEAALLEMSSEERVQSLWKAYTTMKDRPVSDRLYTCGAGLTGYHIDPYGYLQPCLMTTGYRYNLAKSGFAEAWEQVGRIREIKAPKEYECNACEMQPICSGCPALFDLENGLAGVKSEYICTLTQHRFKSIHQEGTSP
ncbi:MAG: radical SAM protein [Kiritimatiellae bacterium]|nr:radical SAM protein [Kiritimatiellia bacterium]